MRQGEGNRILDSIEENDIQLLIPRGIAIWERNESQSTIDLAMASARLFEDRIACQLFANEYTSDPRAVHTSIATGEAQEILRISRYLLQKADSKAIREHIEQQLQKTPYPTTDFDLMQSCIQGITEEVVERHRQKAKPSKNAKRW